MAEIESAEEFAKRLKAECEWGPKYEEEWHPEDAVPLIEARDNAVRLAAKREVLEEIRTGANERLRGMGLQLSPAEAIANAYQEAAVKYSPASTEAPTNVPTPTLPSQPK